MNILKKTIATIITGAMLCTSLTGVLAFTDMPEGEMGEALQAAVDNKLLEGYDDDTVKPYDNITRAQMATIITRAMNIQNDSNAVFNDVNADAWYAPYVSKAVFMGAFEGDDNNNFNPEKNITFQETYTVLSRVLQYTQRTHRAGVEVLVPPADCLDSFSDKDQFADWAVDYAKALVGNGGYKGIDGLLKPQSYVTRGEFAMIMDQLVSKYIDEPGTYTPDNTDFGSAAVIVRTGDVTIDGLNTTKNIILSYGVTSKTSLKNIVSSAGITLYGGSDPTLVDNGDGTFKADDVLVSLHGDLYDIRVLASYSLFSLSLTNADPMTCKVVINDKETSFAYFMK